MAERRLEEYERDLTKTVDDKMVRDIVNDLRSYNPSPSMGAASKVTLMGAGRVIDGDDVRRGTTGSNGWVTPPQVDSWRPPGEAMMNQLMDQQDALDKAERIRKLAEAAAVRRAEAELLKEHEEPKPSDKK
jgi:hypothetical protein